MNPEWRDENLMRNFPFSDTASMITSDHQSIPIDLFVDAKFWHFNLQAPFWLSRIEIDTGVVRLEVTDTNGFVLKSETTTTNIGSIAFHDSIGLPGGVMVLANPTGIAYFMGWAMGGHECSPGAMEFAVRTWIPSTASGLRGFILGDDHVYGPTINMVAGLGVWYVYNQDARQIEWHIPGDPLAGRIVIEGCEINTVDPNQDYYIWAKTAGGNTDWIPATTPVPGDPPPPMVEVPVRPWLKVNGHDGHKHVVLCLLPMEQILITPHPAQHQLEIALKGING